MKSMSTCLAVSFALLAALFRGAIAVRDVTRGRNLLGCTALSFSLASAHSEEKKAVGEAVVKSFAEASGCDQAVAVSEANVKAIATAFASAIAETSAKVEGDDCEPDSFANALASSNAIASAFAGAIAEAEADALNEFATATATARAEEFKTIIKEASAKAGSEVIGVGEATNLAVAEVVAKAVAEAIAEAVSEATCKNGFDGSQLGGPATPPASTPTTDPCTCTEKSVIKNVRTNRPGCKQHALSAGDKGFFCYVEGGSACSGARESNTWKGVFWRDCTP